MDLDNLIKSIKKAGYKCMLGNYVYDRSLVILEEYKKSLK